MKLWKKVSGAIKDRNSIWVSSLTRRTSFRNPDLEAIVIKATSHDDSLVDYKNFQRVYLWLRTSPLHLKPLVWSISMRMEKTRDWIVALKGLMLIHGVFCCKLPNIHNIGRLPFDLSSFSDGHSRPSQSWGYNGFIRAYFAYLDQKSALLSSETRQLHNGQSCKVADDDQNSLMEKLRKLKTWQSMLDMLLQVKPKAENMRTNLIIKEAMICVVTEIFEVYSTICRGIAQALLRIYAAPAKPEASMALEVVHRSASQGDQLSLYFEFCTGYGVLRESECPKIEQIPDEDVRELERIINGACIKKGLLLRENDTESVKTTKDKAIVVRASNYGGGGGGEIVESKRVLTTIITDKWEVFDEDLRVTEEDHDHRKAIVSTTNAAAQNPFAAYSNQTPQVPETKVQLHHLPDLISF
ncbi:hypothetical protein FNV43_RR26786 [Rhamnella rubrinervis]|uniref:ENTH domain-containing protein n=1 Tax=Rhamnella rubrinervis TaxID=2594499 RepID=A0A8K0DJ74_9ROSA|nr:hypothetical protein FNV43_RR26786 [Rhamnella rubrinervis]